MTRGWSAWACVALLAMHGGCFLVHGEDPAVAMDDPMSAVDASALDGSTRDEDAHVPRAATSPRASDAAIPDAPADSGAGAALDAALVEPQTSPDAGFAPLACVIGDDEECRACAAAALASACLDELMALRGSVCSPAVTCALSYCTCGDQLCTDFCGCVDGCRPIDGPNAETCAPLWVNALDCMANACPCGGD